MNKLLCAELDPQRFKSADLTSAVSTVSLCPQFNFRLKKLLKLFFIELYKIAPQK